MSRKAETDRRRQLLDSLAAKHPDATLEKMVELSRIPRSAVHRWNKWRQKHGAATTVEVEDEKTLLQKQIDGLRMERDEAVTRLNEESELSGLWRRLHAANAKPPVWMAPKRSSRKQAIACVTLADAHYDERVNPTEIEGLNAYNRAIAQQRTEKFFSSAIELGRDYVANVGLNGICLQLLGDMVSGNIHEELVETNEAHILPSILFWRDRLIAGINQLLAFYGRVHVAGVVGNHGRQTRKPRSKGRVETNYDWMIYALLADYFAGNKDVTVQVPAGSDLDLAVYDVRYRLTHGDQFRGGSGIAGALSPMMIGDSRKRKRANLAKRTYDWLVMGHWHQYYDFKGIIASPSLKGYDEYAYHGNFEFEEPGGVWWLTDSKKGRTLRAPLHVRTEAEDWGAAETTEPSWMTKSAA